MPGLLDLLWPFLAILSRVGVALMLVPGFSSPRFPMNVRVFVSLAVAFAMTPLLIGKVPGLAEQAQTRPVAEVLLPEIVIGIGFGFWCFCFMHAVRFAGAVIANSIGLAGIPGLPVEDQEANGTIGSLLALAATAVVFASGLHLVSLRALVATYEVFPFAQWPAVDFLTTQTLVVLRDTFVLALRISSPFIVFAVVVNVAIGLAGKFTPSLQVYFASLGLSSLIGLALLSYASPQSLMLVMAAYGSWLESGFQ